MDATIKVLSWALITAATVCAAAFATAVVIETKNECKRG